MATTIQVSETLLKQLQKRKLYTRESYEEVIRDLMEDSMEVNAATKRDFELSRKQLKAGKTHSLEAIKRELRL